MGRGALESTSPDGVGGCLVRFRLVWFGMVWYGLLWLGMVWYVLYGLALLV